MRILILALLLFPATVVAQSPSADDYRATLDSCYAQAERADDLDACRSLLSDACIAGEPQGQTTRGTSMCLQAEFQVWDERLNIEYRATMARLRSIDDFDRTTSPEFAVRAERLRDAQRAWIVFRDADCAVEYALWSNGSLRLIAGPSCLAQRTFERLKTLINLREQLN